MVEPISPDELTGYRATKIPDWVYQVWNDLIALHWNGNCSRVELKDAKERLMYNANGEYDPSYLEIEDIYQAKGWKVEFHKPDYTESFPSFYEFRKGSKR